MLGEIVTLVGVPLLRGLAGWAEKSFADKKVNGLEWKKLAETVLLIGTPGFALVYGFELAPQTAIAIPVIVHYVYHIINKAVKKKQVKK